MTDVAIVGLGPVGGTLAILLGQLGHAVSVFEKFPEPYGRPRAVHFDHEIGRILQSVGIGTDLANLSEPTEEYEWRNATGKLLLRFGNSGHGISGWPASNMMHQPALEDALSRRITALPNIRVHRGVQVDGLSQNETGTTLSYTFADGSTQTEQAKYVVGCDGANSTIRSLTDAPMQDLGFFYDWLILDVIVHDKTRVFKPQNLQICDPARPTTVVSGGPGRRRWEFMRLPGESLEELNSEERAWELLSRWELKPTNATLERHTVYTFQARWVDRWRTGRVFLAGDAAHEMPPFAGQGMCAGLRDAANLAWKLSAVLRDQAHESLLDNYQTERNDHVQRMIQTSIELGKIICVSDPVEAAERDEFMGSMAVEGQNTEMPPSPGFLRGIRQEECPVAGKLSLQGRIRHHGLERRLDDAVGAGWRLLSLIPVTIDEASASWFASVGGVLVVISEADDINAAYREWFAKHEIRAVIQRPDFVVFGSSSTTDVNALVEDLRSLLEAGAP